MPAVLASTAAGSRSTLLINAHCIRSKKQSTMHSTTFSVCCTMVATSLLFGPAGVAGRLEGIVIDAKGAPVAGAHVQVADLNRSSIGIWPEAYSGRDGRFRIDGFKGGAATLTFFAGKPNDFYPEIPGDFYSSEPMTTVRTAADGSVSGVRVHLAPQCGRIEGTVIDHDTGAAVAPQIEVWRAGNAMADISTGGNLAGGRARPSC